MCIQTDVKCVLKGSRIEWFSMILLSPPGRCCEYTIMWAKSTLIHLWSFESSCVFWSNKLQVKLRITNIVLYTADAFPVDHLEA